MPVPSRALLRCLVTALLVTPCLAAPLRAAVPLVHGQRIVPSRRLDRARPQLRRVAGQPVRFPRELLPYLSEDLGGDIVEPGEATPHEPGERGLSILNAHRPPTGTNLLINDPSGDDFGATQSENSIAAHGRQLVAGWNDGFDTGIPESYSGFGYSSDGGRTWTDGGTLPHASAIDFALGDPCLTVDGDGNFYYATLYSPDNESVGVSVSRGRFHGNSFTFGPPVVAGVAKNDFGLDKEWIAADPENGFLYLAYVRFLLTGGTQIELVRSLDHGRSWTAPAVLTDSTLEQVQGPRPVVGPDHEVYVAYRAVDLSDFTYHMRIRKSTRFGKSFGPEVDMGERKGDYSIFLNGVNGPPGFNRATGVELPSIAVDRSSGRDRGTVYVTWPEAIDYFDDPLGGDGDVTEVEGNDTPAAATPFVLGTALAGTLASGTDADWYSFSGKAGQTVEFFLTPADGATTEGFLRLYCRNGLIADRLALSDLGGGQAYIVFTLPSDGTYLLRVLTENPSAMTGDYAVYTGTHVPQVYDVARDARDVMLTRSRDGIHWTPRARVNHDAPRFDNAFPEVAVDGGGDVHLLWLDHRNDPACGILTDVYAAHLDHGRLDGRADQKVNDGDPTNWSLVASNLAPNMGDYIGLRADGDNVYANWADGRLGSPDCWMATLGGDRHFAAQSAGGSAELTSGAAALAAAPEITLSIANPVRARSPISVSFVLPRAGEAQLDIYSVTGERVRSLLRGAFAAGAQRITWDANGQNGTKAQPGVYFVVLRTPDTRLTRRVMLLP